MCEKTSVLQFAWKHVLTMWWRITTWSLALSPTTANMVLWPSVMPFSIITRMRLSIFLRTILIFFQIQFQIYFFVLISSHVVTLFSVFCFETEFWKQNGKFQILLSRNLQKQNLSNSGNKLRAAKTSKHNNKKLCKNTSYLRFWIGSKQHHIGVELILILNKTYYKGYKINGSH